MSEQIRPIREPRATEHGIDRGSRPRIDIISAHDEQTDSSRDLPVDPRDLHIVSVIPVRRRTDDGIDFSEPLVLKTVNAALSSKYIDRVIISTDDEEIASKANTWGAEAPFLRPAEYSSSTVRADEVLKYSLEQLEGQGDAPDIVVPLESTYPFRPEGLLDHLVELLLARRLDTVIAGFSEYRPCWLKRNDHLVRIDDPARLRRERDPVHIGLISLGCATYPQFIRKGSRLGDAIGIYEIRDPIAALEIRHQDDLRLMETLQHVLPQWREMLKQEPPSFLRSD